MNINQDLKNHEYKGNIFGIINTFKSHRKYAIESRCLQEFVQTMKNYFVRSKTKLNLNSTNFPTGTTYSMFSVSFLAIFVRTYNLGFSYEDYGKGKSSGVFFCFFWGGGGGGGGGVLANPLPFRYNGL